MKYVSSKVDSVFLQSGRQRLSLVKAAVPSAWLLATYITVLQEHAPVLSDVALGV